MEEIKMKKLFLISDTHFGDERSIQFCCSRNIFHGASACDRKMIKNWNRIVGPDDIVFHLGDFCSKEKNLEEIAAYRAQLNGKIRLLKGNNDVQPTEALIEIFDEVYEEPFLLDMGRYRAWCCHYPCQRNLDYYTLTGHIHEKWRVQMKMLNVGVDVNNFKPLSVNDIKFSIEAEEKGYWDANVYPDAPFEWRWSQSIKSQRPSCEPTMPMLQQEKLRRESGEF
jgi:calcineurin-like phosphoesterase family protein